MRSALLTETSRERVASTNAATFKRPEGTSGCVYRKDVTGTSHGGGDTSGLNSNRVWCSTCLVLKFKNGSAKNIGNTVLRRCKC